MHYHCEIILPPDTINIEQAVNSVLRPFDENPRDNAPTGDEENSRDDTAHTFWDWWVIGGRWAGKKLLAQLDQQKLAEFEAWMDQEKLTVNGFRTGKPALEPMHQIDKVDAKWRQMFPEHTLKVCPLFAHSNDQYGQGLNAAIGGDVSPLGSLQGLPKFTCSRVIFAGHGYKYAEPDGSFTGELEGEFMLSSEIWNGCNFEETAWDGTLKHALEKYDKYLEGRTDDFRAARKPTPEWITVTVDYHS